MRHHPGIGSLTITVALKPRGPAAAFVLNDEQVAVVGEGAKRFPARTTINGAALRTTVARMRGEYLFGLNRAAREQAGLTPGDTVTFTLELDTEPRVVDVPAALTEPARRNSEDKVSKSFCISTVRAAEHNVATWPVGSISISQRS